MLHGKELTGREIMEKQKDLQRTKTEYELQKMILVDRKGNKEKRDMRRHIKEQKKDVYRSLMVFMEPGDIKGTSLLNWQHEKQADDQWLYMPATKKMQRIAEGGKKNYFMGTDFTYEDLQSEDTNDFNYERLRKEKCLNDTKECYVVEAKPATEQKKKETGYGKRVLWVTTDNFVTTKTEYYSRRMKHIKTQNNMKFKHIGGTVWRSTQGIMDNHKLKHKTLFRIVDRKINSKQDDSVFTERYILKGKHVQ